MADGDEPDAAIVAAVVLAAGSGSRFGGSKMLAAVDGRPVLQHVLDRVARAGIADVVVVLGDDGDAVEGAIAWRRERRIRNPEPSRGIASSLRIGVEALDESVDAALILLGDQPAVPITAIRILVDAPVDPARSVVVPRYPDDRGRNPVLLRRPAFRLISEAHDDRGLGPILAAHPELVLEVPVEGANPDVDTRDDLAALVEAAWAARVRENRDQVDRIREVPDPSDFYAPTSSLFRADPHRTDEAGLDILRSLVVPAETWLDIGAGAGRYALPIALLAGEVIAVDPSDGMLTALREQQEEYGIENVRAVRGRWPPDLDGGDGIASALGPFPCADVSLVAHVGYDIEAIGPFVRAMEAAARRLCVAVLMERQPSSIADVCWPPVHGEARVALPALPQFVELLRARGRDVSVTMVEREPRRFEDRAALEEFLRRQLWIAEDGEKDARFRAALDEIVVEEGGRVGLRHQRPLPTGIVTWRPGP